MRRLLLVSIFLAAVWQGAAAGAPKVVEPSEDDLLVLEVRLGDRVLGDGLVAYRSSPPGEPTVGPSAVLLPLGELAGLVELAIRVDPATGTATGWLGEESERFELDLARGRAVVAGRPETVAGGSVELHPQDIYVESGLLSRWLPVDFMVDLARLVLRLEPRLELPLERRLAREARWRRLGGRPSRHRAEPRFAAREMPYQMLGWPVVDGRFEVSTKRQDDAVAETTTRHSLLAQGDLLGMTGNVWLSGHTDSAEDDLFADARLTLSRQDPRGKLLGPLRATDLRLGDLVSPDDRLVSRGHPGRGVELARDSGRHLGIGPLEFDRTTLRGDALPGWDVELYRNEVLFAVATIGADGRYELADVPLFYGRNRLRLVFYGPHGEIREKVEELTIGTGLLPPGALDYHFGIYQQDVGLVRRSQALAASDAAVQGELRMSAGFARGLTRRLSYDAGLYSLALVDGRHDYVRLGLRGSWLGTAGRLFVLRDLAGGAAGTLAFQRRLGRFTLTAEHTVFEDFTSEEIEIPDLLSRTEARLDGQLRVFGSRVVPLGLTLRHERRRQGSRLELRGSTGLTLPLGPVTLTNRWHVDITGGGLSGGALDADQVALRGSVLINAWIRDLALRGNLRYDLLPEPALASVALVGRWRPGRRWGATFGFDYGLAQQIAHVSAGAEWQLSPLRFGVDLGWGSDDSLRASASLSFSLGRDPRSGRARFRAEPAARRGVVSARAFLDHDANGRFDAGDEALEGVYFSINGSRQALPTDADGITRLSLSPFRHVDLAVDETSFEDPFWKSRVEGLGFVPRPGVGWTAEFPIVVTGELDGTVTLRLESGNSAASKIRLQLLDAEGGVEQEVESQFDGFYLFDRVSPGLYTLRVDPLQSAELGLRPLSKPGIRLGSGEILTLDLSLERALSP